MMARILKPLSIAALTALALPAAAQDTQADSTVSMGEPAASQPGTPYVDEVFGDWARKCITNPDGDDPCQLYQLIKDDTGNPTAEISLAVLPAGQPAAAGATVVVPLETLLTQQLTIDVDGQSARRYPFRFCTKSGCYAQVGFTAEEIEAFKRGSFANLTIVPAAAPDQKVVLKISLSGFTAGYDSLPVPAN